MTSLRKGYSNPLTKEIAASKNGTIHLEFGLGMFMRSNYIRRPYTTSIQGFLRNASRKEGTFYVRVRNLVSTPEETVQIEGTFK
jgi:hypothetical protein